MSFILQPWQLYLLILSGGINREQQEVSEYLRSDNQLLKEKLGKRRILLDDDQRRRLAKVGYQISDTTVENILQSHGIEPAPIRKRTGSCATFLQSHWVVLAAIDFTTIEVWTKCRLVIYYLLLVMEWKTRRVPSLSLQRLIII